MTDEPAVEEKPQKPSSKADIASLAGVVVALVGLIGGLLLEGGKISDLLQYTAGIIVLGGTLGATMLNTPLGVLKRAARGFKSVFFDDRQSTREVVDRVIEFATKARKNGIVSLEREAEDLADPFLRKAVMLAVDGADLQEIRKMMELEIAMYEHHSEAGAKVFEVAGGYAPTIGIIGAVMGLIQVMKNLANIDEVGHGIAVSFVATVYGVGLANLFLLPAAGKVRARGLAELQRMELILEGVCGIVEGLNPKLIRSKLEAFLHEEEPSKDAAQGAAADAVKEPQQA